MDDREIEAVALAFYNVTEGSRGWNREPERLKAKFRSEARAAIAAIDESREMAVSVDQQDLIPAPRGLDPQKKAK
jgi:hypothetical protein